MSNNNDVLADELAVMLADHPWLVPVVADALIRSAHLRYTRQQLENMPGVEEP